MQLLAVLLFLLSLDAPGSEADPPGTVFLDLEAGESKPIQAESGASAICDDPHVVAPEFTPDIARLLDPREGMKTREIQGGTGPETVAAALIAARIRLANLG